MEYLIDGYNMVHRIDGLRAQLTKKLEKARMTLIARLTAFARHPQHRITVVFDGTAEASSTAYSSAGITVRFARPPQNADTLIKKIIDEHPKKKQLTVVSSDMAVFRYAKASGCVALSSESFYQLLAETPSPEPEGLMQMKGNPNMSDAEIKEWLHLFDHPPSDDES